MGWPRYITTRHRAIEMAGTFRLPVSFYVKSVQFTIVNFGTPSAAMTADILAGGWLLYGYVKARCGPWTSDGQITGTQGQREGLTWQLLPISHVFCVEVTPNTTPKTYDVYANGNAQVNGLNNNTAFATTASIYLGTITSNDTSGFGNGANPLVLSPPVVVSWVMTGAYDLLQNLSESLDVFSSGTHVFGEDWDADAGRTSLTSLTVNHDLGSATRSITYTGASQTTQSLPHFDPYLPGMFGQLASTAVDLGADGVLTGGGDYVEVTESYTGSGVAMDAASYSFTDTPGTLAQNRLTIAAPSIPSGKYSATNSGSFYSEWRKGSTDIVQGSIRNFDQPNADALDIEILSNGGVVDTVTGVTNSFSRTYTRTDFTFFTGFLKTIHLDTSASSPTTDYNQTKTQTAGGSGGFGGGLQVRVKAASATALGLSPSPYLIPGYGWKWNAVNATMPDSVTVDQSPFPLSGGSNWTATNATLSEVAGKLRIAVTAGTNLGRAARNLARWIGERYAVLRIRTVGSANQPFVFTVFSSIGNNSSLVSDSAGRTTGADGVWKDVVIDLTYQPAYQTKDFAGVISTTPESADGTLFGNNLSWFLSALQPGVTYEIESIKLVKKFSSYLHGLSQITGTVDGARTSDTRNPGTIGQWAHFWQGDTQGSTGGFDTWSNVGNSPERGWQTSVLKPRRVGKPTLNSLYTNGLTVGTRSPLDDLIDEDASAGHLFSGGLRDDNTVPTEQVVPDAGAGTCVVAAQYRNANQVTGYTGAGDIWNLSGGAYGTTTTWNFGLLLRGATYGIVIPKGNANPGAALPDSPQVKLYRTTGGADAGSGNAEPSGYWHTGTPYGLVKSAGSTVFHTLEVVSNDTPHPTQGSVTVSHGLRGYFTFLYTPVNPTIWLSADISATGRMGRAYRASSGHLMMGFAADALATSWADADTGITGDRPCFRYERPVGKVWFDYEGGGAVLRRSTDNEGGSFAVATTINASGTFPTFCLSPTGAQHHFWISGGAIAGSIVDSQGNVMQSGISAVASGVAADAITAWYSRDTGRIYLSYRRASDSAIMTVSSADGGQTFS